MHRDEFLYIYRKFTKFPVGLLAIITINPFPSIKLRLVLRLLDDNRNLFKFFKIVKLKKK